MISFMILRVAFSTTNGVIVTGGGALDAAHNAQNLSVISQNNFRNTTGASGVGRFQCCIAGHPQHKSAIQYSVNFNAGAIVYNDHSVSALLFKQDTSAAGGSITIPHGLIETDSDDTTLTLTAANDVTVDLWVF